MKDETVEFINKMFQHAQTQDAIKHNDISGNMDFLSQLLDSQVNLPTRVVSELNRAISELERLRSNIQTKIITPTEQVEDSIRNISNVLFGGSAFRRKSTPIADYNGFVDHCKEERANILALKSLAQDNLDRSISILTLDLAGMADLVSENYTLRMEATLLNELVLQLKPKYVDEWKAIIPKLKYNHLKKHKLQKKTLIEWFEIIRSSHNGKWYNAYDGIGEITAEKIECELLLAYEKTPLGLFLKFKRHLRENVLSKRWKNICFDTLFDYEPTALTKMGVSVSVLDENLHSEQGTHTVKFYLDRNSTKEICTKDIPF
jgi:hypothetical protein